MGSHLEAPVLALHWAGRDDPEAPTLVLFHGLGDSGECWPDAVARWSPRFRIAGVDALGHGDSPRFTPEQLASADPVEEMYAAAEATLTQLVAERSDPVVIVGHSMGGGTACALASRRPDLVCAAVLEEPAWRDPQFRVVADEVVAERIADCRGFRDDYERQLAQGRAENPTWPESELEPWGRAKTTVDLEFLALGAASFTTPWEHLVAAIGVPTLVVTGETGVLLTDEIRKRAEALGNPEVSIVVVPGAGHCVRRDQPQAFHAIVDPFIARHS